MTSVTFESELTGLLIVDPYNDFISEGGKLWPRAREVAEGVRCVPHMIELLTTSRAAAMRS